jgi:hypothetical protein
LPNVHFLWCTARKSPQSLSQRFPTHKTFTPRFHHCGSHILRRPPFVPRLGDKYTPSPKSKKAHLVLLPQTSMKLRKITCYSTNPTHISHVLGTVNIHSFHRFPCRHYHQQTVHNKYSCSLHYHQHPPAWIP